MHSLDPIRNVLIYIFKFMNDAHAVLFLKLYQCWSVVNFELVHWKMKWGNCDCSFEGNASSGISFCDGSGINIILMLEKYTEKFFFGGPSDLRELTPGW